MSKEFKVGDRVKVIKKGAPGFEDAVIGDIGTIEKLHIFKRCWLVKFDKAREAYNTNLGRFDRQVGYWCTPDMLQDLSLDEKIIITTDGVTTTARRYIGKELQGTAEAKCSPSDTFDFEKSANLAFGRLIGGTVIKLDTEALAKALKNVPKLDLSTLGKSDHWLDRLKKAVEANPEPEPEPKPKFKAGDLVRVKGKDHIMHHLITDSLAVVKEVRKNTHLGYVYDCEGTSCVGMRKQVLHADDLEKYEKE